MSFVHLLCAFFHILFWNDSVASYPTIRGMRDRDTVISGSSGLRSQHPPHLCGMLRVRSAGKQAGRQEVTVAQAGLATGPAPGTHPLSAWVSFQAMSFPEPLSHTRDLCSQGEVEGTLGLWKLE